MNQQMRVLVAIALSMAIMVLWQLFFMPPPPERAPEVAEQEAPAPAPVPPPTLEPAPEVDEAIPEREIRVGTPLWEAVFSSRGGALLSFELLGPKQLQRPKDGERLPMDMAQPGEGQPLPLSTPLTGVAGFEADSPYRVVREGPDELVFARTAGGIVVEKHYRWSGEDYRLGLEVTTRRTEGAPAGALGLNLLYTAFLAPGETPSGFFGMGPTAEVHQAVCLTTDRRSMETYTWSARKPSLEVPGMPRFAGIDKKYFIAAMAPLDSPPGTSCELGGVRDGALEATLRRPIDPPPGGAETARFDLYLGPKDFEELEAIGHGLERSVDFGFFAVVSQLLLAVLKFFERGLSNWGVAIVVLTLLVKILTFPLTHKQMVSMEGMRRLAPKMEEIKKRYGNDQQKVGAETLKLYKEHNVNPLGGCLPMLIQMPVWFALYATLSTSFELYNEPFIGGWINDLTTRDPYYVLPVAMAVTMILTQWLTPQPQTTPQMKYMMYGLPIFFGFIMLSLPAGLVLYIFTNNVLSIAQSLWFRRKYGQAAPAAVKS